MPISWQHFDYTELLELLGNYKRAKSHLVIKDKVGIRDSLRLCPHYISNSCLSELDSLEKKVQ
jgi:hypothetical protein